MLPSQKSTFKTMTAAQKARSPLKLITETNAALQHSTSTSGLSEERYEQMMRKNKHLTHKLSPLFTDKCV